EETVRRLAAEEADRRRAATILESIADGFFAVDDDWRFTYVNRQAEDLLGRRRDDLLGKQLWEEYPDLLPTDFGRAFRRAVAGGAPVAFEAFYAPHGRWYAGNAYPSGAGLSVY